MITSTGYIILTLWLSFGSFAFGTAAGENAERNKQVDRIEVVQTIDTDNSE